MSVRINEECLSEKKEENTKLTKALILQQEKRQAEVEAYCNLQKTK